MTTAPLPNIVGLDDIAHMFDVEKRTAETWRYRGALPEPYKVFGKTPTWLYADIVAWGKETGRPQKHKVAPPTR